jgi:hypothetical protein
MNANPSSQPTPGGRLLAGVRLMATPLTIATFLLCGGTGLMLFFDVRSHTLNEIHEWSGIAMAAAVGLHLVRNWQPTLTLFRRWPIWTALGGATIAAVLMLALAPSSAAGRQHRGGDGPQQGAAYGRGGAGEQARAGRCEDCDDDCRRGEGRRDGRGRGLRRGDGNGPRRDGSGRDRD